MGVEGSVFDLCNLKERSGARFLVDYNCLHATITGYDGLFHVASPVPTRIVPNPAEALLLLLDVSPSMHNLLPEIEKLCSMLVQKKLIYNKSDEVGVVLFGTEDTDNELTKEVGGYEHVVVLQHIKVVEDLIEGLQKLPRGTAPGDCIQYLCWIILLEVQFCLLQQK
ncbi:hypothetical protein HHK36_027914 [Tetracentron sinense]|uniref:Ku70/Ku80 N-terminal alpha/beta domain-containing protein n=1 Tax=Tetracentron sinense TaxID=13715 RepID=A0A835D4U9_TETSI|nr:hypothetical protein HHK36_027914 [Tetracentron sinense]